jgi:hypothetical protein
MDPPGGDAATEDHVVVRLVATDRTVYVLVGNELMAFDAGTVRPKGTAIVPARPLRPGTLDVPDTLDGEPVVPPRPGGDSAVPGEGGNPPSPAPQREQ